MHLVLQAIGKVNTLLAKELAVKFDAAKGSLKGVNPQLASFLSSSLDTNMKHLQNLPATMGYLRDPKGAQPLELNAKHKRCSVHFATESEMQSQEVHALKQVSNIAAHLWGP